MRFNLDPFDCHSDAAIWEALDHAHLGTFARELPGQLEYVCEEGGQNLRWVVSLADRRKAGGICVRGGWTKFEVGGQLS